VAGGRPLLRSVDSEIKRRVIEPRNFLVVSPRLGQSRGPSRAAHTWTHRGCTVTPGSESRANGHEGSPGNLGGPDASTESAGRGYRLKNPGMIRGPATGAGGDERRSRRWYRRAKETKRGEKGGGESERLILPTKRGNQPEGPRRGKGVPSHDPSEGNMPGTSRPASCPRNDDGSRGPRTHGMTSQMRGIRTSGSVGAPGEQSPGATRPEGYDPEGYDPEGYDPEG
jgi:hypothetical protein